MSRFLKSVLRLSTIAVLALLAFSVPFMPSIRALNLASPAVQANMIPSFGNFTSTSTTTVYSNLTSSTALSTTTQTSTSLTSTVSTTSSTTSSAASSTISNTTLSSSTTFQTTNSSSSNQTAISTSTSYANTTSSTSYINSTSSISNTTIFLTNSSSTIANATVSTTNSSSVLPSLSVTTKWNPYTDFYHFLNYGLFNDGGDCYGFSSTAILYFRHYQLGDQSYPYYPESTTSVSSMPGQTIKYCLLQQCFGQENTLSESTFPLYIHEQFAQQQVSSNSNIPSNEQTQAQLLMQSIQNGIPVLLGLGPVDGHAVVAYAYAQNSNGSLTISISDPNYGNTPRYASYTNGQFLYKGTSTWTTFIVVSPEILQWNWLSPTQLSRTVDSTNPYYNYVFSDAPITIVSQSGSADFGTPGDSLTFNTNIMGVVGFEEGNIQLYAIPKGVQFAIKDPGETSSSITMIIPESNSSIVGYQLSSSSSTPLSLSIIPTSDKLNVTTSTDVSLSVSLFSAGQTTHSILNASSIPVSSSDTAVFSVPDWQNLNSTQSGANLQVYGSNGSNLVTSQTLINGQQGVSTTGNSLISFIPFAIVGAIIAVGVFVFVYRKQRNSSEPTNRFQE